MLSGIKTIINSITLLTLLLTHVFAQKPLLPQDLLQLKAVKEAKISPDGQWIAYTISTPRQATDKPGENDTDLYLMSITDKTSIPFVVGTDNISSIQWKPDGSQIAYKKKSRDKSKAQVWSITLSGGEVKQLTDFETGILNYKWHPNENKIGFIATTPMTKKEKILKKTGYKFIYYEEDQKHRNLYLECLKCDNKTKQLTNGVTVWDFEFSPDGNTIAADISPENLIDHKYMFRKIFLLDLATLELKQLSNNPGKLGNYAFSPDGKKLAYCAALTINDHQVSQVYVMSTDGIGLKNLTPDSFRGHIRWASWKDDNTIIYYANEGVWSTLSLVNVNDGKRDIFLNSNDTGIIFNKVYYTANFKDFVFVGHTPSHRSEVYYWNGYDKPKRLSDSNPILDKRTLGKQRIYKYKARDGQKIEGMLIYPVNYEKGKKYPLIMIIHGGPESNYSNGWLTGYGTPGQVLAGKGYFAFYPNYRSSTGYGLDFANNGLGDPAGVEFDDIADGIDALIDDGYIDKNRIGLVGGSYGGYAAAWFSSYYTDKVKAVNMRVGISNNISRRGTTDIPYEEMYVHSGKQLEEMWELSLKRSPIYYAHQSKTAVLITGGADDTRVHPSQSLEYYRRLKMNGHPAVRLVQYPGEEHGSKMQTSQMDQLYRTLDWFDWYVKDGKPIEGPMPPLDISNYYGVELE
jgi:dipeptidyl aminopeptidase/acylaminoacyl peptidase